MSGPPADMLAFVSCWPKVTLCSTEVSYCLQGAPLAATYLDHLPCGPARTWLEAWGASLASLLRLDAVLHWSPVIPQELPLSSSAAHVEAWASGSCPGHTQPQKAHRKPQSQIVSGLKHPTRSFLLYCHSCVDVEHSLGWHPSKFSDRTSCMNPLL